MSKTFTERATSPLKRKKIPKLTNVLRKYRRLPGLSAFERIHPIDGRHLPFKEREELRLEVWRQFHHEQRLNLEQVRDRTKWPFLAVVGTPGSGKTRFIAEVLRTPHAEVAKDFPHYLYIHSTYNNGNEINEFDREKPVPAFALRLLYHRFIEGTAESRAVVWRKMCGAIKNRSEFSLVDALQIIRDDYIRVNKLRAETIVNIAVGVDEYSKWLEQEKALAASALKDIVDTLGSMKLDPPKGVRLFVLLGGSSQDIVRKVCLTSTFPLSSHRLHPLSVSSTLEIAQHVLQTEEVFTDACFRAVLLDVGGHPRLLEQMLILIRTYPSLRDVNWKVVSETLAKNVIMNWGAVSSSSALQSIIVDMIQRNEIMNPGDEMVENTELSYDQLERLELGLRFDNGTPSVPYLCLQAWLLDKKSFRSPMLPVLRATIRSSEDDQPFSWQNFEVFCAQYLALRIAAWAPEGTISLQDLLRGAVLSPKLNLLNVNVGMPPRMEKGAVFRANHRFPKNLQPSDVGDGWPIVWKRSGRVVLNSEGAPFDFFVSLDYLDTENGFIICGQTKYYKHDTVTQKTLDSEYQKVQKAMNKANLQHWMLLVLSTGTVDDSITLPDRCAVVALPQFESFFGRPFAERVHFWCTEKINVNTAPQWALRRVQGVGKHTAQLIATERSVRPFSDKEDVRTRLGLADTKLNRELLNILTF